MEKLQFNLDLIYIIINLILFFVFLVQGRSMSKRYRAGAIVCTLIYSIVLGLRYKRGNDYIHYVDVYAYDLEDKQVVYTWFTGCLKSIGVGPYGSFFFYALVFCICFFVFYKQYRIYAKYAIPLFLVSYIWFEEYMIRQVLGFSMVFLYTYELSKFDVNSNIKGIRSFIKSNLKKIAICFVYTILAYGIHSSGIVTIFIITLLYIFIKKPLNAFYTIPFYLFFAYVFPKVYEGNAFGDILQILGQYDDKVRQYGEVSDDWFSADAMNSEYDRPWYTKVFDAYGNIALFYFGYKVINRYDNRKSVVCIFNSYVVGCLLRRAFYTLEVLNRLGYGLECFWFLPLAMVIHHRKNLIKNSWERLLSVGLLFFAYEYIKYIFFKGSKTLFLWDK